MYVLGGISDPGIAALLSGSFSIAPEATLDRDAYADNVLLRKFWPIGESVFNKPSRPIFKVVKFLCQPSADLTSAELFASLERLKRRGLLEELSKNNLITLNLNNLAQTHKVFEEVN